MLTALGVWTRNAVEKRTAWTDVYGVARTLLAVSTALTLLFNSTATLFLRGAVAQPDPPMCDGLRAIDPFCLVPSNHLELARWICVVLLVVVASGWRPRLTGLVHWWIAFGLHGSANILDGGDNVCAVLTLLLLPVTLTDRRKWHWQPPLTDDSDVLARLIACSALLVIRLQISGIYFHAALAKTSVAEWSNGTALYYWLLHDEVGAPRWLLPVVRGVLLNPVAVTLLTWSVVMLEFLLSAAILVPSKRWHRFLVLGLLLHAGILVVQGLFSFSLAMAAALVLYLRPPERTFIKPSAPGPRRGTGSRVSDNVLQETELAPRGRDGPPVSTVLLLGKTTSIETGICSVARAHGRENHPKPIETNRNRHSPLAAEALRSTEHETSPISLPQLNALRDRKRK